MKKIFSLTIFMLLSVITFSQATTLFISEIAEGTGNNKYLEIYNGTGADIDLSNYSLSSCSNGCNTIGEFDYPDNITFPFGTILSDGEVYIVAHQSADLIIQAVTNQTFTYLSNGDDVFALTLAGATASNYTIIDIVGDMQGDPGSGWAVAGISNGTKEHTLIRKSSVCSGNTNELGSFGTDAFSSEWIVESQNYWTDINQHIDSCGISCDTYASINEITCNSYNSPSGLNTWTTTGTYTDTIPNSTNCDSIITINLTINSNYNELSNATICNGSTYTFGSQLLTSAGQYTEIFTSTNGCDSTVTLDLTVVNSYTENTTTSICDGEIYTFGSQSLISAGQYSEVFTSATGCDSTVNLTLIVLSPTSSSIVEIVCESYIAPDSSVYNTSGVYTVIIPNLAGCDSTITIDLTINSPSYNSVNQTSCDSFTANNITYTTSGTYTQTIPNAVGCDSVITFFINITPTPNPPILSGDQTICDGDILNDIIVYGTVYDSLIISGVVDAPLPGGLPKCIEFYAVYDIPDLSSYGFGSANNGGGSDGQEFTFPTIPLTAGSTYTVATDTANFISFFGQSPDNTDPTAGNVNGDDAIELFHNGVVIDVFGDINTDGSGEPWEYLDGWAYRNNYSLTNGGNFDIAQWTFSGINALDGEINNASANNPFPINSFISTPPGSQINWYSDPALTTNIGTGSTFTPSNTIGSTDYYATETLFSGSTCEGNSSIVTITINPLPIVTFNTLDTVCNSDAAFSLNANPVGGLFSGNGVIGNTFDPTTAGNGVHTITYSYTDSNMCTATQTTDIIVNDCASINNTELENLTIYPNPTSNVININSESNKAKIYIYSLEGKKIYSNTINTSEQINVSNLETGTYILKIQINKNTYTKRLIIK